MLCKNFKVVRITPDLELEISVHAQLPAQANSSLSMYYLLEECLLTISSLENFTVKKFSVF